MADNFSNIHTDPTPLAPGTAVPIAALPGAKPSTTSTPAPPAATGPASPTPPGWIDSLNVVQQVLLVLQKGGPQAAISLREWVSKEL